MSTTYYRSYPLKHFMNQGKVDIVIATLFEYRKTSAKLANNQWRIFFETGKFNKNESNLRKNTESKLSERFKQTAQYQVVGGLKSFISNRKNDFNRIVYFSNLDDKTKKELFTINRKQEWFKSENKLARKIVKHILKKHRKPSFAKCNMVLDAKQISIETSKTKEFDYWIKLSTINKGNNIYVPLKSNTYFNSQSGDTCNSIQVNYNNESKKLTFAFIKEKEQKQYTPETDKIGLDVGLNNICATNFGDLFGRSDRVLDVLKKYDNLITNLARNRQKQGLKVRSRKYDKLVNNVRQFLKNEINRILNQVVKLYKPGEIVIERLLFKSMNLSKRLNRILSNFGRNIFQKKLYSLFEEYGIQITEINAAYTSQECSSCHYVDKKNRSTRDKFSCKNCGQEIHADINASRSILNRRSIKELSAKYVTKSIILRILKKIYFGENAKRYKYAAHSPAFNLTCNQTGCG